MNRALTFCFDYLSPYAYLAWLRIGGLCESRGVQLELKPVLLPGLLQHWGQLGPAEIPPKRQFVVRDASRLAARRGVPFRIPAKHPFNPLPALRASLPEVAGERQADVVSAIFRAGWADGADIGDLEVLGRVLGAAQIAADEILREAQQPGAKDALRKSTEDAIALGVFGVPTTLYDGHLFWGDDQMESIADVLDGRDPINARALDAATAQPLPVVRPRRPSP